MIIIHSVWVRAWLQASKCCSTVVDTETQLQRSLWVHTQSLEDPSPKLKVNESIWIQIRVKLGHNHNCLCN